MADYEDVATVEALSTPGMTTSVLLHAPPVFAALNKQYELLVTNPQKQSEKTFSYVAYTVKVKKLREGGAESSSFRRFSDFLWLHDHLRHIHPSCVVPPLPEKALGRKFSADLLLYRSRELTRFLQRIADHPVLAEDDSFAFFLTAPWAEFTEKRALPETPAAASSAAPAQSSKFSSVMSSITDTFRNLSFAMKVSKEQDPDPWFGEQVLRMDQLEAVLTQTLQSANALALKIRDGSPVEAAAAMNLRLLGRALASTDEPSAIACSEVSKATEQCVKLGDELANQIEHSLHDNVKDYIRELDEIRAVLDHRLELVRAYTVSAQTAQAKKGKGTAQELADAERARDLAMADLDAFSKAARADILRAYAIRKAEFARVLNAHACVQRDFCMQTLDSWRAAATASAVSAASTLPSMHNVDDTAAASSSSFVMQEMKPAEAVAVVAAAASTATVEKEKVPEGSQPAPVSPYSIDD